MWLQTKTPQHETDAAGAKGREPAAPISAIDRIPSTPNVGMVVNFNLGRRQRKRPQQRPLFLLRASNQTWLKVVIDKGVGRMQLKARRAGLPRSPLASMPPRNVGCCLWIEAAGGLKGVYSMPGEMAIKMTTPRQTTESTGAPPNEDSG